MKIAKIYESKNIPLKIQNASPQTNTAGLNSYVQFSSNASNAIKNNATSLINFKNKQNNIDDIVLKLKNVYGIEAKFENLDTAKMLLECVEDFAKLNNNDIFKGLKIDTLEKEKTYIWSTMSNYNDKTFTIKLNNSLNPEELKNEALKDYNYCNISSNNPKYYFYESLAEYLNFNYNPYIYTQNSKNNNFAEQSMVCARKMGNCATISLSRFNSAYMASRMCGVEIPPDTKKHFSSLGGSDINLPSAKITKSPFCKNLDFKTTKEVTEHLKQYGIEAEFENIECANLVASAIEDFIKINNNPDLFKGLKISKKVMKNTIIGGMSYTFDYAKDEIIDSEIILNQAYDWKRHKQKAWYDYACGHHTHFDEKNAIYHELAHWLHFNSAPRDYAQKNDNYNSGKLIVNDYGKKVYGKVSGYAQSSGIEFVAEYITGRMSGLEFPKSVNEEYEALTNLNLIFP